MSRRSSPYPPPPSTARSAVRTFIVQGGVVQRVKSWSTAEKIDKGDRWTVAEFADHVGRTAPRAEVVAAVPAANRLGFLDFVRGIAAFAVLLQHTGETLWPSINWATHQYVNIGRFGVVAFFLVSGFIIPFSLERGGSVRRFGVGSFFRLYPLYWVSLIAILVIYQFRHARRDAGVSDAYRAACRYQPDDDPGTGRRPTRSASITR